MSPDLWVGLAIGVTATAAVLTYLHRRREARIEEQLEREVASDTTARSGSLQDQVLRTVARLKRERDSTEAARDRLEQALDRMLDGVIVCDSGGRVLFTNAAGAVLADARHEDTLVAAAAADALSEALAEGTGQGSVEMFGPPARTVTIRADRLGTDERPLGAVAVIVDQSRVRRLESVRSDFVANVSHELKTPIGGLAVVAEALADASDEDERARLADHLHHEAHRVGRVIDDLLVLSEVEGDLSPDRRACAVTELIERAAAEVATLAAGHGVEVVALEVEPDLTVLGDPVQLTSAVVNLVENAVKYSGGFSPVEIWAHGEGAAVRLGVTDRGPGIPSQDLDRIFERFYRVDRARSRATGGTGLGLAIVRNVAHRHGGEVEVRSREGEGSTFVLTLPRLSESESESESGPESEPAARVGEPAEAPVTSGSRR